MSDAPSLRDTIESAMSAEPAEPAEVVETAPAAAEPAPEPVETVPEPVQDPKPRTEDGKFTKAPKNPAKEPRSPAKPAEQAAPPADKGKPAGAKASPPPTPAGEPAAPIKAPSSWKPAVRELAAKLPAEFRPILEESIRVDNEAKRALNDSAQARQLASQVQGTLAPFESLARANGMDPLRYAGTVMQTAAALHMGTPQQKAAVLAQLINTYQIDVDAVNAVMQGQAPAVPQAQPQQDVGQLVEQAIQSRLAKAAETKAQRDWDAFQATEPEFLDDVRESMVTLAIAEGQRGRNLTPQQLYDLACKLDEGVSQTLAQRKATESVRAQAPAVKAAKAAAVSIKASPGGPATRPAGPSSLRETIEAAMSDRRT